MSRNRGSKVYNDPRWKIARSIVLKRADWHCEICGLVDRLEVHHLDPIASRGGIPVDADFDVSRLQGICRPCHFSITGKANRREKTKHEKDWDSYISELL